MDPPMYVTSPGQLARIVGVNRDGSLVLVYPSGQHALATANVSATTGDVVFIDEDQDLLQVIEPSSWPASTHVGVVRLRGEATTLIEVGSAIVGVPTSAIEYCSGYTVSFNERGVLEVHAEYAVRAGEASGVAQSLIDSLKYEPDPDGPGFDDFGGMPEVVARAKKLIDAPLLHGDKLEAINAKPIRGVLFTGDPGTGKTHLARIIANQAGATFYLINGPSIVTKWVGDTEAVVRAIFEDAAEQEPAIVFFDEIDSIAARRTSDSREHSRQLVTQLLAEIDGFTRDSGVLVIGATNRADDLDPALRRPGRLDWELEFPMPTQADRAEILRVSARDIQVVPGLHHDRVAARTEGWTPADLSAIWTEASLLAAFDGREWINAGDYLGGLQAREIERAARVARTSSPSDA